MKPQRMSWAVPIYTSLPTFLLGLPEMVCAVRRRPDGSTHVLKGFLGLIVVRLVAFYTSVVFFFAGGLEKAAVALLVLSLVLYYVSFAAARTIPRDSLTRSQKNVLFFSLITPTSNLLFDVGGSFNPLEHFILIVLVLCAAALAVVHYTVLGPLHKAYGCYPAHVLWHDLDKGLCPQFFGDDGDESRSPICREEDFGDSCEEQLRPPPSWYYHTFAHCIGAALIVFFLGAFAKYKGIVGRPYL